MFLIWSETLDLSSKDLKEGVQESMQFCISRRVEISALYSLNNMFFIARFRNLQNAK